MWKCASVALFLAIFSAGAIAESPLVEVDMDTDVCAMTEVLVAMKKLLILLSTEIRDLRDQVKNSCHSSGTTCTNATTTATTISPSTVVEAVETQAPGSSSPASTSTDDLDNLDDINVILEVDEEEDEDFDYVDPEDNPVSEVISGVKDWWGTFSLFPSKTTTDATITSQPDDDDHEEEEDKDEDVEDSTTMAPKRPTTTTTSTTTTTTTTTRPYTLPPAPTRCPSPYSLIAGGCFLMVHNSRDWKTWGNAYAFCQDYSGELASPWRLSQLQDYLIRHFSDAFWVGARRMPAGHWEWLTGRKVDQEEWKPGQPNRHPGKKCVFLDKWSGYHANNFFCGEKYPFICESRV